MTSLVLAALLAKPMPERLKAFRQQPKAAYPLLRETAFDANQNLQIRWRAITSMGALDAGYFLKDLEQALVSKEWFVRNAALIAVLNEPRDLALKWSSKL